MMHIYDERCRAQTENNGYSSVFKLIVHMVCDVPVLTLTLLLTLTFAAQ